MSADLVTVRRAIAQIAAGKEVNEDGWMTLWRTSNWARLLQPAPLSLSLLGTIMLAASTVDDFSLQVEGASFKKVRIPDSFKASLQQIVGEGYTAFETAQNSMTRIQAASTQLPDVVRAAVVTVVKGSPEEIGIMLPTQLEGINRLVEICRDATRKGDDAFDGIINLAAEILGALLYKTNKTVKPSADRDEVARVRAEQEKEMRKRSEEVAEMAKKTYNKAANDFEEASRNMPSGWDLIGMHLVESLTDSVTTAANSGLSVATANSQHLQSSLGNASSLVAPSVLPTVSVADSAIIGDPGSYQVPVVLSLVHALRHLVSGGPDGKADLDKIRNGGAKYIQTSLRSITSVLERSKPVSSQLIPLVDSALQLSVDVAQIAVTTGATDDSAFDSARKAIVELEDRLKVLVVWSNLHLHHPGISHAGPATPQTAPVSSDAAKLAVEHAKFQVDSTRASIEAARKAYDRATVRVLDAQKGTARVIAEMAANRSSNVTINDVIVLLRRAIKAFSEIRVQFFQLSSYFEAAAAPAMNEWTKYMDKSGKLALGGVLLTDWVKQLIYAQLTIPIKVGKVAEKISETYLDFSNRYIMPVLRNLGNMLKFRQEEGSEEFAHELLQAYISLQKNLQEANDYIAKLVEEDQKNFSKNVDQRLDNMKGTLSGVLPSILEPPPKQIVEIMDEHVEKVAEHEDAIASANTALFNLDGMA